MPCAPSNRMRFPWARSLVEQPPDRRRHRAERAARSRAAAASSPRGRLRARRARAASALWCSSKSSTRHSSALRVGEVANPDRPAPDLVLVGRADAAPGGAELLVAAPFLAGAVERAVRRQDQRRVVGELQGLRGNFDALGADRVDLVEQCPGIDDDAVADDRQFAGPHHARGQQAQLVLDIADDDGVAGIVAALKADHDIGALRQPVDDLALALVAPLGADDGDIAHPAPPSAERLAARRLRGHGCSRDGAPRPANRRPARAPRR